MTKLAIFNFEQIQKFICNSEFWRILLRLTSQKNRAFRSKSSDLLMQILWAFRFNPLRGGSSETIPEIAYAISGAQNCCSAIL
jgi:hypothetical protein